MNRRALLAMPAGLALLHTVHAADVHSDLFRLIDDWREKQGVQRLHRSSLLMAFAQFRAEMEAAEDDGLDHSELRLAVDQYHYQATVGENLASGFVTPEQAVQGWIDSPGHNANMRGFWWREMGVGVARTTGGTWYWSTVFGDGEPLRFRLVLPGVAGGATVHEKGGAG